MRFLKRSLRRLGLCMVRVLRDESGKVEFKMPNPGVGWTWVVELLIRALGVLMPIVTPSLREALETFLKDLYAKAKETANPWDDFLTKFLMRILGIEFTD